MITPYDGTGGTPALDIAVLVRRTPPRMLGFGATNFAAVARISTSLGPASPSDMSGGCSRRPSVFREADGVVCAWPNQCLAAELAADRVDARTVMCLLIHDHKFDVPLLEVALPSPAGYIGAMGSRRTHDDRLRRLREGGVPRELLRRLHAPIGLDLGARTAEETAVLIAAELVQVRWGGSGRPLGAIDGAIHRDLPGHGVTS